MWSSARYSATCFSVLCLTMNIRQPSIGNGLRQFHPAVSSSDPLSGVPGSGKTTFARRWRSRWTSRMWRAMPCGSRWLQPQRLPFREWRGFHARRSRGARSHPDGRHALIDATNLTGRDASDSCSWQSNRMRICGSPGGSAGGGDPGAPGRATGGLFPGKPWRFSRRCEGELSRSRVLGGRRYEVRSRTVGGPGLRVVNTAHG